jgi:hypothetical protein
MLVPITREDEKALKRQIGTAEFDALTRIATERPGVTTYSDGQVCAAKFDDEEEVHFFFDDGK